MLGAVDGSFTTAGHRQERQFDVWRGIVSDAFAPVELDAGAPDVGTGFAAACEVRRVGGLTLSWLRSAPQQVHRTSAQASTACGVYFLNFALDRSSTVHQDGRTARVRPGDFAIVDGDRPFRLEFPDPFEQLSLSIPKAELDPAFADVRSATAVTIPGDTGIGAIAAAAFTALAVHTGRIDGRVAETAIVHVIGLLAAALGAHAPAPAARRGLLYRTMLEVVEQDYADAELSLQDVARRIAISESYAAKLFAANGTTFGRLLLGRRLDHAWNLLVVAPWTCTITDVALRCGFHDSAHFARAFRARFGITPSERRGRWQLS